MSRVESRSFVFLLKDMKNPIILRLFFGLSFLFSAYTKFIAPGYFEITLLDQGIAPTRELAAHLARFFIGIEFALGILFFLPFYTRKLLLFSIALLGIFSLHLAYLSFLGDSENCGCFGEMISLNPEQSLLKNGILLSIAFWLYIKSQKEEQRKPISLVLAVVIIASMWFFLPLAGKEAQKFNSFTHFEGIGRVDLSQGEVLVAVFNLDCEHCQEAATALGELTREQELPPIYVLYFQEGTTTVKAFEGITQTNFPYTFIDTNTFFDLIGASPPRIYFLKQGRVDKFWDQEIKKELRSHFSGH